MVYFSLLESVLKLYHKHTIICLITIAALSITCQLDFVMFRDFYDSKRNVGL